MNYSELNVMSLPILCAMFIRVECEGDSCFSGPGILVSLKAGLVFSCSFIPSDWGQSKTCFVSRPSDYRSNFAQRNGTKAYSGGNVTPGVSPKPKFLESIQTVSGKQRER